MSQYVLSNNSFIFPSTIIVFLSLLCGHLTNQLTMLMLGKTHINYFCENWKSLALLHSADNAVVNTSSSSHQVDRRRSLFVFVFVLSQVRNGDGGRFIEGSLRWLQRYNGTHDRQRRLRSERLCNQLLRHRQNLCTNKYRVR